eukprot:2014386-Heterocapsa_arctica.AAC.1
MTDLQLVCQQRPQGPKLVVGLDANVMLPHAIYEEARNSDRFNIFHAFCDTWNLHAHNTFHVPLFNDLVTFRKANRLRVHESQRDYILSDFVPSQIKSWASRDTGGDSDHYPVFADLVALKTPAVTIH